jgi:hypothetical protein
MQPKYRCWLFYNVIITARFSLIIPQYTENRDSWSAFYARWG